MIGNTNKTQIITSLYKANQNSAILPVQYPVSVQLRHKTTAFSAQHSKKDKLSYAELAGKS